MTTRLSTYKPYAARESLLTWAPNHGGGRAQQATLFRSGTIEPVPDALAATAPIAAAASSSLVADAYRKPPAGTELRMLPMEKSTAARSSYGAAFRDVRGDAAELADATAEALAAAAASVDRGGDGYLLVTELRMALTALLRHEPSDYQLKVLQAQLGRTAAVRATRLCRVRRRRASRECGAPRSPPPQAAGGRITHEQWAVGVVAAGELMQRELHCLRPDVASKSLVLAARYREAQDAEKRRGVTAATLRLMPAEDVAGAAADAKAAAPATGDAGESDGGGFHVHGPRILSRYQHDMGAELDAGPAHRPVMNPVGGGLYSTTRDLMAGEWDGRGVREHV